jgi:selenoprotein W-related protein
LASQLLTTFKQKITDLTLVPSGGGCFELAVDGDLIYSKLQTGSFPDEQWAVDAVGARVKKKR